MPQWRKLHTKATESLDIHEMEDDFTRLLWLMLPLALDQHGRGVDNPAWVKAKILPLRDDVNSERIERALAWYAERGMIERYTVDGRSFFWIPTWYEYQGNTKREADSLYPPPPSWVPPDWWDDDSDDGQNEGHSDCVKGQEPVTSNSRVTHEQVKSKSCSDVDSDADAETDSEAEDRAKAPSRPPPRSEKPPKKPPRDDQLLFGAVGRLCYADLRTLNNTMRGKLNTACKTLRQSDATPADVKEYTTWWYSEDWRGQKRQRPTPSQIVETWGSFCEWRDGNKAPPHFPCKYTEYDVPDRPPPSELDALWAGVCAHLQGVMDHAAFELHFTRAHPVRLEDGTLVVALPDDAALVGAERLRAGAHIAQHAGGVDQVEFVVEDQR
jgi:hypothetical protein